MASPPSPQPEYLVPAEAEFLKALKSLNLVPAMYDQVDVKLWNVPATIDSPSTHLLTYLLSKCADYVWGKYIDGILLSAFCEDFERWDEITFAKVPSAFKRALKIALREGGVYTGRINGGMNKQLAELLRKQELQRWDDNELAVQKISPDSMWYHRYTHLTTGKSGTPPLPHLFQPPPPAATAAPATPALHQDDRGVVELGGRAPQVPGRVLPAAGAAWGLTTTVENMRGEGMGQQWQNQATPQGTGQQGQHQAKPPGMGQQWQHQTNPQGTGPPSGTGQQWQYQTTPAVTYQPYCPPHLRDFFNFTA